MSTSSKKRIIPCLDMKNGRVVKGVKFEHLQDIGNPLDLVKRYYEEGADELAFLDIGSDKEGRAALFKLIGEAKKIIDIPLCVGGGIRSVKDAEEIFSLGGDKVSVCSSALERPELLTELSTAFGKEKIVLAIDAKRTPSPNEALPCWTAYSGGGRVDTGMDALKWAEEGVKRGAGEIMLNSIDADGTEAGYDMELCASVSDLVSVPVIASGGAGSLEQIAAVLRQTKVSAALVASMLHYGKTSVAEIRKYLESELEG